MKATKQKKVRSAVARALLLSGLFKAKVVRSKKSYTRKVKHKGKL